MVANVVMYVKECVLVNVVSIYTRYIFLMFFSIFLIKSFLVILSIRCSVNLKVGCSLSVGMNTFSSSSTFRTVCKSLPNLGVAW